MVVPGIIHSGEHDSTSRVYDTGVKRPPQVYYPPTEPTTKEPPYQPPPRPSPTTSSTSSTTTAPPYIPPIDPDLSYDYEYEENLANNPIFPPRERDDQIDHYDITGVQSDSSKQTSLIISIVAGILIIIILIILFVLKCKSRSDARYKVDESKNYSSLSQGPTMIVNGQGNGQLKPGDRRPVKKQSKDVKEWYV